MPCRFLEILIFLWDCFYAAPGKIVDAGLQQCEFSVYNWKNVPMYSVYAIYSMSWQARSRDNGHLLQTGLYHHRRLHKGLKRHRGGRHNSLIFCFNISEDMSCFCDKVCRLHVDEYRRRNVAYSDGPY